MTAYRTVDLRGIQPKINLSVDTTAPTGGSPASRTYSTDLTPDLRSVSYTLGGRADELQRSQTGTLVAVLSNVGGKYAPVIGSAGLKIGQWIQLSAKMYYGTSGPRWTGVITRITRTYPQSGKDQIVTIEAADAMKVAGLYDLSGNTFSSETSDQRVKDICTAAGLAYNLGDTGASTMVAISGALGRGSMASTYLQNVEATENGQVYAQSDGRIKFESRHYRLQNYNFEKRTIGYNATIFGTIPTRDAFEILCDDSYVYNSVAVTPTNSDGSTGTTQTATDSASQTTYFTRNYTRTIEVSSTTEALACAQFLISKYSNPVDRVQQVELMVNRGTGWTDGTSGNDADVWSGLPASLGEIFLLIDRFAFAEDGYLEQVSETCVPGQGWRTFLQFSPVSAQAGWVLGDSYYGLLGQTTVLIY